VPRATRIFAPKATSSVQADILNVLGIFARDAGKRVETELRIGVLEKAILEMRSTVDQLARGRTIHVPISSLAPEPYAVVKPLVAVVVPDDDQFIASFYDANLHSSGDTEAEAIDNLKEVIASTFRRLSELGDKRLGPLPAKQLATLNEFVRAD